MQVRVKCNPEDTIGDLKKLIAAQTGTKYDKIVLKKWYTIFKDQIKLSDCKLSFMLVIKIPPNSCYQRNLKAHYLHAFYSIPLSILDEIHDGMNLELYYQ